MSGSLASSAGKSAHLTLVRGASAANEDIDLLRGLRHRDPGAQRVAWQRYSPLVHRLLQRLMAGSTDVADAAQDAMVRFFARADRVDDAGSLRPFLVGICYRVASEQRRAQRIRGWLGLTDSGSLPEQPVEIDLRARAALARLDSILEQLSSRERALFVLRYIEQLELAEISVALELSLSTTRRHLERARGRVVLLASRDPVLCEYLEHAEEAG